MNRVTLIGRLAKDPEIKYTGSQTAVCRAVVAVDRPPRNGEQKQADFLDVVVFGKQAEALEKWKHKGDEIAVDGTIRKSSYEKDGKRIYTVDIIAERVEFIGGRAEPKDEPSGFAELGEDLPW